MDSIEIRKPLNIDQTTEMIRAFRGGSPSRGKISGSTVCGRSHLSWQFGYSNTTIVLNGIVKICKLPTILKPMNLYREFTGKDGNFNDVEKI